MECLRGTGDTKYQQYLLGRQAGLPGNGVQPVKWKVGPVGESILYTDTI